MRSSLMRVCSFIGIVVSISTDVAAGCPAGERMYEGECTLHETVQYLVCLKNSGDGKIGVKRYESDGSRSDIEVGLSGKGSGVVFKGEGNANIKKAEAARSTTALEEQFGIELPKNCLALANRVKAAGRAVQKAPEVKVVEKTRKEIEDYKIKLRNARPIARPSVVMTLDHRQRRALAARCGDDEIVQQCSWRCIPNAEKGGCSGVRFHIDNGTEQRECKFLVENENDGTDGIGAVIYAHCAPRD